MAGRRGDLIAWVMTYGPALAWVLFALWYFGPTRGYGPVLRLAIVVSVGIVA